MLFIKRLFIFNLFHFSLSLALLCVYDGASLEDHTNTNDRVEEKQRAQASNTRYMYKYLYKMMYIYSQFSQSAPRYILFVDSTHGNDDCVV